MQGWIKLYRKLLENPIVCKDSDHLAVWVYLLLNATHEAYPALFKGKKITLEPGQLITGRKSISNKLSVSESKVKRILIELENDHQIDRQRSNQNSLISILNWDKYQDCADVEIEEQNTYKIHTQKNKKNDQPVTIQNCYITTHSSESFDNSDQPVTSHRPASDQPVTTNKNVKNNKNNIYVDFFEQIWQLYPKKEGKGQVSLTQKKKLYSIGLEEMTRAIDRYKKDKQGTEKQYLKNGSTFFNSGYVDYLDANYQEDKPESLYREI